MPKSQKERLWDMMWKNRALAEEVLGKKNMILWPREARGIATGSPYELDEGNGEDALKIEMKEWGL